MSKLLRAGLVVLFCVLSMGAQQALAADTGSSAPASDSTQISGLMQDPNIGSGNKPMRFEQYGPLAYTLTTDTSTALLQPWEAGMDAWANMASGILVLIGEAMVAVVEWAFSLNLVTAAGSPLTLLVSNLQQHLYAPYEYAIIILLCCWLTWVALVRHRLLKGVHGLAWAIAMLVLGGFLMASPTTYLDQANAYSTELSSATLAGVANEDPSLMTPDGTDSAGPSQSAELRLFCDRTWTTWIYDPWTMVEFGALDPQVQGRELGVQLLRKQSHQSNTYDQDLAQAPQSVRDWAGGHQANWRLVVAVVALVFGAVAGAMVMGIALLLLLAGLGLLLLAFAMVPILLVAPLPGFGRRLFEKWAGLILVALITKVVASMFLVLVLAVTGAVGAMLPQVGWFLTALLEGAALWLLWHSRRHFLSLRHHAVASVLPVQVPRVQAGGPGLGARAADWAGNSSRARIVQQRLPALLGQQASGPMVGRAAAGAARGSALAAKGAAAGQGAAITAGSIATAGGVALAVGGLKVAQMAVRGHEQGRAALHGHVGHLLGTGGGGAMPPSLPRSHPSERDVLREPLTLVRQRIRQRGQGRLPPPPASQRQLPKR